MNIVELYEIFRQYPSVETDTRKIKKGDLFFALRGPNFNANAFAEAALDSGAVYAIIDDATYNTRAGMILVDDVLSTLQQLASYHRNQFNIPFLAITGSNGKTTTKELVHAVLRSTYKTYTTYGNLNNHIGIPLTILDVKADAEMAVIEMGANHIGEIASYCLYTRPGYGLITNVGKAHLEGFGGYEGVKKGKGELFDYLRLENGTAFVMWDYDYLKEMSAGIKNIVKYGHSEELSAADAGGSVVQSEPFLQVAVGDLVINTQLIGTYNFPNVLAAVAVGKYFKVEDIIIKKTIESYQPSNSRSQLIEKNGNRIVLDAYNANPSSMKAAIENFGQTDPSEKTLILGAMAELGEESLQEHRNVLDLIDSYTWKKVILVGGDFLKAKTSYLLFNNSAEAADWFKEQSFNNDYFLVKGSRSMQMEKVIE